MLGSSDSSDCSERVIDTLGAAMLEGPQAPPVDAARPRGASNRLKRHRQFSLLVVRGDGARVLRVSFASRLPLAILAILIAVVGVLGALVGDWWHARQRLRDAGPLLQRAEEQRATLDTLNQRIAELRREVASWREIHARIWEPFGPERAPQRAAAGIGGGGPTPSDRPQVGPVPSEELAGLAEVVMEEGESLRALDRLVARARKALAALPSRWPARGAVNSEYGNRRSPWTGRPEFHGGIDIAAEPGTPVRAPAAGTVAFAGRNADYGLAVVLDHGQEIRSVYGHLSRIMVSMGQRVERGGVIGLTGNSGRSSGPHLHYEILVRNQSVNPRAYLWD